MPSKIFTVEDDRGRKVLETDDWAEAERRALTQNWPDPRTPLRVRGIHPTHDWDDQRPRRCRKCDGWDNGSYGSHAPCGFEWTGPGGSSLIAVLERLASEEGSHDDA
jgi:hypothetical protein